MYWWSSIFFDPLGTFVFKKKFGELALINICSLCNWNIEFKNNNKIFLEIFIYRFMYIFLALFYKTWIRNFLKYIFLYLFMLREAKEKLEAHTQLHCHLFSLYIELKIMKVEYYSLIYWSGKYLFVSGRLFLQRIFSQRLNSIDATFLSNFLKVIYNSQMVALSY